MMRRLLLFSMLSGLCGLTHEVLLSRILGSFLGETVVVNVAILCFFFLGLAGGTFFNRLFFKWLWLIEVILGLLGLVFASLMLPTPTVMSHSLSFDLFLIAAFALPIGFLAGTTVPLFSSYLRGEETQGNAFNKVYLYYNLAAAFFILLLDQLFIKKFGLQLSYFFVASFNILTGLSLKLTTRDREPPLSEKLNSEFILAVFGIAFFSGVIQFGLLKLVTTTLGPHRSHFALYVFSSLFALPLATVVVNRFKINFQKFLELITWLAPLCLLIPYGLIWLIPHILKLPISDVSARLLLILLLTLPALFSFALLMPSLAKTDELKNQDLGKWLGLVSLANAIGLLLHMLFIYEIVYFEWTIIIVAIGLMALSKKLRVAGLLLILIHLGLTQTSQTKTFRFSYRFLESEWWRDEMAKAEIETYRNGPHEVSLFKLKNTTTLVVDGYKTIKFIGTSNPSELLLGFGQALYSQNHDRAVVVGTGSGITVNVANLFYKETVAVELNSAVANSQPIFRRNGFGLEEGIPLLINDGFRYIQRSPQKFDAIINNATSPQYSVASKLWTRDFWEMAKSQLAEGGIASTFMDGAMNPEAIQTIFKTMQEVFPYCHMFMLREKYGNLICANSPLSLKIPKGDGFSQMAKKLGLYDKELTELSKSLSFPIERWREISFKGDVNSIDRPILDYVLNLRLSEVWSATKPWHFFESLQLKIDDFAYEVSAQKKQEAISKRCEHLGQWHQVDSLGCKK